ncbi:MAG: hypothetical protein L3J71_03215 [Victivallaceae bacterium]|nr:hypothetical protein [Victivallaceae bacterium]
MKLFITSDINGSKAFVKAILALIKQERVNALVIAGNIAPRGLYQFFKIGQRCEIHTDYPLKERKMILAGDEQKVKNSLDLLGFMEVFKRDHNLISTKIKKQQKLHEICELLKKSGIPIYMLSGHYDYIHDGMWHDILSEYGICNLNLNSYKLSEFNLIGFHYNLPANNRSHNGLPEIELQRQLSNIEQQIDARTILVTNCPPKGILDKGANGDTCGSSAILNLIKTKQPVLHCFGKATAGFGNIKINNTICCNVSSKWSDLWLRGCILETEREIKIKEFEQKLTFSEVLL